MLLLQVGQFAEQLKAPFNFSAVKILQALGPEAFHGKRSHYPAIKQSSLQHLATDTAVALRRNVSHESAGKGIAGAGGIHDFFNGQRRRAKRMRSNAERSLAKKDSRSVFAVLYHQRVL